jgi:hypothetical protein
MGDVPLTDRGIAVLRGHSVRVRNGFESFEDPTFHRSQAHREHPARTKRSTRKPGGTPGLSAGQPIRVRLLSRSLPSIGKRPFDRDDLFPRSHAAYGPLDVLRPKADGDSFFGGTPADVGPGREKRPEPLEHHRDNSGDRGNESAVLPLNYRPNPMEGEVSLLKR